MSGRWIERLTWPEVASHIGAGWPVIIPIGARSKEHGPHLPMQTDYLYARGLCDGIARSLPVLIAPVVDFGYYPAFIRYPGSQHVSAETFGALLGEIVERFLAQGVRRLAILNTGVSTEAVVDIVCRDLLAKGGPAIPAIHLRDLRRASSIKLEQKLGGHADEAETSVMLALAPDQVHMDRAKTDYGSMVDAPPRLARAPTQFNDDPTTGEHYSLTGVRGDPMLASADKGRALLDEMIAMLVAELKPLCPEGSL